MFTGCISNNPTTWTLFLSLDELWMLESSKSTSTAGQLDINLYRQEVDWLWELRTYDERVVVVVERKD